MLSVVGAAVCQLFVASLLVWVPLALLLIQHTSTSPMEYLLKGEFFIYVCIVRGSKVVGAKGWEQGSGIKVVGAQGSGSKGVGAQ